MRQPTLQRKITQRRGKVFKKVIKKVKDLWDAITYPFIAFEVLRDEERRESEDYGAAKRGRG